MKADRPDPFVRFAAEIGLSVSMTHLTGAPRDVLAPPADLDWYTLATISRERANGLCVRTIFVSEASEHREPRMRDILWWLSSDAWAIERADRDARRWAELYRYESDDEATHRLFELHLKQADALAALLGAKAYGDLLAVYESEIASRAEASNSEQS